MAPMACAAAWSGNGREKSNGSLKKRKSQGAECDKETKTAQYTARQSTENFKDNS